MKRLPLVRTALTAALTLAAVSCLPDASRRERADAAYLRIVAAEDARPSEGPDLQTLIQGTEADDVMLRGVSYRALGRLENPALVSSILPGLQDPAPSVRDLAANAVAQAYRTSDGSEAIHWLLTALETESDPQVRGTLARSLGRTGGSSDHRDAVLDAIVDATYSESGTAPLSTLVGAVLGLEAVARAHPRTSLGARAEGRLRELVRYGSIRPYDLGPGRIRTMAAAALGTSGALTQPEIVQALRDEHPQVGATAFRFIGGVPEAYHPDLVRRAVVSPSVQTIIEAFRFIASQPRTQATCQYLMAGAPVLPPEAPVELPLSVRVAAIDGLAEPCPDLEAQRQVLVEIAGDLPTGTHGWQPAAHGLNALARVAPAAAGDLLTMHAQHENDFVRAWAARSAAELGNRGTLRTLAADPTPNVRTAALRGLFGLDGRTVDGLLIEELTTAEDPQLLMAAANLLGGTDRTNDAAAAAIGAFERISLARRETWRDPRVALLDLLDRVGDASAAERLTPYLQDYDPVIADRVAAFLANTTGRPATPAAEPPEPLPLPTPDELREMDGATIVLHMAELGEIHITLLPYEATTNAYRFFRLARDGYFDGLTFHRWARNFVIQGGSPNANEYQGDGPFTRDEVGLVGHWRGFVGVSTRGHDTGDGQIFVNLIDNVRLDHAYTVIGAVTQGMDVVDAVLEGSVIERAEVRLSR